MSIAALVEERARQHGPRTFLICEDTEYSFEAMHERSTRVAVNLAAHGVQQGDKVVLLMGNCLEYLYVFLGAGRIGAVIVPVNPTLKADEIAHITNNSEAETLITVPELAPLLPQLRAVLPSVKRYFVAGEATDRTVIIIAPAPSTRCASSPPPSTGPGISAACGKRLASSQSSSPAETGRGGSAQASAARAAPETNNSKTPNREIDRIVTPTIPFQIAPSCPPRIGFAMIACFFLAHTALRRYNALDERSVHRT